MRYQQTKKVTLVSAFSNALLAIIKIIVGSISHSHALFADGIHSVSDLFTDFLILIASKYGEQAADEEHPYGHHRIETAATFFLSLLLVVTGCAILFDAYNHLFTINQVGDSYQVLSIVIFSLIANELLFHYTLHHGKKLNSRLLIANAWHHRSDSLSSGVVLIGTIGSLYGLNYSDPLAALFFLIFDHY